MTPAPVILKEQDVTFSRSILTHFSGQMGSREGCWKNGTQLGPIFTQLFSMFLNISFVGKRQLFYLLSYYPYTQWMSREKSIKNSLIKYVDNMALVARLQDVSSPSYSLLPGLRAVSLTLMLLRSCVWEVGQEQRAQGPSSALLSWVRRKWSKSLTLSIWEQRNCP